MERKLLFVFHPRAGKAQIRGHLCEILDTFAQGGCEITAHPTQRAHDAAEVIAARAPEYDLVVVSGGDGTLHEAVNGMMRIPAEKRPPLGYIPAGTVNDFAASLHISRNMRTAAADIMQGNPFACDIGCFCGEHFSYVAAFGAFTDVSYDTPQQTKNMLGQLAYILEGIKRLPALKSYVVHIEHDSGSIDGDFLFGMVANTTSVAGIHTGNRFDVQLDDGLFEVVLIKRPANLAALNALIGDLMVQNIRSERFCTFKTSHLTLTSSEPIPWTLDGEFGGAPSEAEITICPRAITFLVGSGKEEA